MREGQEEIAVMAKSGGARSTGGKSAGNKADGKQPDGNKTERQHRRSPAELRSLILDAACVEFGANGFASTTNRDVARRAGVALSVLYRHFETKADLFSEAVLEPFVRGMEQLGNDWLRQLSEPLEDERLMEVFIRDIHDNLAANQHVLDQMLLGRGELPDAMLERIRVAFEKLITQLRLMTELEARRRGWMSTLGVDMSVRVLMGMMLGMSSYSWMLLPDGHEGSGDEDVIEGMVKLGLWGMTRHRDTGRGDRAG
ncbi:MAG TPA: TetR family transcriptional regulator [Pseudonocardia sp.]|nr:TetR family transcriptional regulator [Pseudonocardia sp.]